MIDLRYEKLGRILDVANFNNWLAKEYTGYDGRKGAPGIVGRADKLSFSMIKDYFFDQGVECTDQQIFAFQKEIRKDWFSTFMSNI